ncbi:hypothetical protein [Bacillus sp. B-jedd]|uniref:hypothetical protein n=1 Tax=Bacillus sp. B-jedd TaxID=1476857 RepID=UPI0005156DDA|nr:hypothetical protein [Bacillus sp. B-jedd]CEG26979.1 Hypothetical protein BN1002_01834 [Bacillus sp. B-jedd]
MQERNPEEKNMYFVDIKTGEITMETTPETTFTIIANEDEVQDLRELFEQNYDADKRGYLRAHVPWQQYHTFSENENADYDTSIELIYAMLYKLGDGEARKHIESMGILKEQNYDNEDFK